MRQKSIQNPINPRKAKSLLTIKAFSEISGIEQTTLRYWEAIGLFRPACRNPDNNYRYYSPDQIILVNFFKALSCLGISLKVIASISQQRTPEAIFKLLDQQEAALDMNMSRLHESDSTLHTLRNVVKQSMGIQDAKHISVQALEAMPITLGSRNENGEGLNYYHNFIRYCQYAKENHINLNNPIGGYYESLECFLSAPSSPTRFFSVNPHGDDGRAAGKYLVGYSKGYYGQLSDAAQRLGDFAAHQGLNANGPVYVLYLRNEICATEPSDFLAQICVALELPDNECASGC